MSTFLRIALFVFVAALVIFELSETARYFTEKKWGWFGLSAYLAIYWMAWIITHSLVD